MADLLVNLFDLAPAYEAESSLLARGIRIKRALAPDRSRITAFAATCAEEDYSDEVSASFANSPVTCYIATKDKKLVGFACFEATAKNFFGPMAVSPGERNQGIGRALLLRSLESMREMGYAYAVIGWPARSAVPFYENCAGAIPIGGTSMGIYQRMIAYDP